MCVIVNMYKHNRAVVYTNLTDQKDEQFCEKKRPTKQMKRHIQQKPTKSLIWSLYRV